MVLHIGSMQDTKRKGRQGQREMWPKQAESKANGFSKGKEESSEAWEQ